MRMGVLLFALLIPVSAQGARFPDATEGQIVLVEEAAASAAALLGLTGPGSAQVFLRVGPGEAWAVHLLKKETKEPLYNDNDGTPARYNRAAFTASSSPTLSLSSFWLDLGTALPATRSGYFSFGSPFISESPDPNDPWTRIFQRLRSEPQWNRGAVPQLRNCFTSAEEAELCVELYAVSDYTHNVERHGYIVRILAHPKNGRLVPASRSLQ
jgi:hypothetical protein